MRLIALFALAATVSAIAVGFPRLARAESANRISGPFVHDNLSVYFVHGTSAPGPTPLTLQEALAKGSVRVIETGSVNELKIENTGAEEVFIQSGDIVKGGRQDRVLTVSFILAPKSGEVPIASYCVEQGRWSARGKEDSARFSSADHAMPSREAKLAMKAPAPEKGGEASGHADVGSRQQKVWSHVSETQSKLSAGLNSDVTASRSKSSLQLSLENEKLEKSRGEYVKALQEKGEGSDDVVGYVFAVNGHINSADIYPSNGLFRKMWPKLLAASVTEAIGERSQTPKDGKTEDAKPFEPPAVAAVEEFLKQAEQGKAQQQATAPASVQETRDADESLYVEAKRKDGGWVHRNYLKK